MVVPTRLATTILPMSARSVSAARRCQTHRHDPVSLPCCAVPDSIALTRPHASNACEGPLRRRDAGRREPRRSNQTRASGQFSAKQIQAHASKCKQKMLRFACFYLSEIGSYQWVTAISNKKIPLRPSPCRRTLRHGASSFSTTGRRYHGFRFSQRNCSKSLSRPPTGFLALPPPGLARRAGVCAKARACKCACVTVFPFSA